MFTMRERGNLYCCMYWAPYLHLHSNTPHEQLMPRPNSSCPRHKWIPGKPNTGRQDSSCELGEKLQQVPVLYSMWWLLSIIIVPSYRHSSILYSQAHIFPRHLWTQIKLLIIEGVRARFDCIDNIRLFNIMMVMMMILLLQGPGLQLMPSVMAASPSVRTTFSLTFIPIIIVV